MALDYIQLETMSSLFLLLVCIYEHSLGPTGAYQRICQYSCKAIKIVYLIEKMITLIIDSPNLNSFSK